ncbi:aspartate ammonia-lyase [Halothermothrix orenii]|uniref:Aspartate ammonia-lyase n=1 Tax=Halothermothrix orenii (strain H 168 / OCM 544 / DSM 9562) TaxID=373903 RepID=B8D1J9_HALOH|nr:aspartate ammonia-lyase [Halothermothrix orenii]ACL69076.1 aspartate ammonia-lyase [Halothermothrix orenii H 168]
MLTRKERDPLGEKEVPRDAYYGIQTLRAAENFQITNLRIHPELIKSLAYVKKAAASVNIEIGMLNEKIGKAIIQATDEVINGSLNEEFIVDALQGGAGTSINMNMNEVLANRAIEILGGEKGDYSLVHPNNHVNMGQSTNDVYPTAIRITAIKLLRRALEELSSMYGALTRKSGEFDHIIKMGRTQLQDAVPIRLGQEFGAYASAIKRDIRRIKETVADLKVVNLGATAIGTGLNADHEYVNNVTRRLNELTGLDLTQADDLIDATQNADALVEVSSALKTCAVNLSKIASDLRLLSSGPRAGLNEINLPAVPPGSSIMPGKVNPVIPEVVNQIAYQIIGNDTTITMAAESGQLELNVMIPVLTFNLFQSIEILKNGVKTFTEKAIEGITVNEERCKELVDKSVSIITAINPHVGYEVASRIAKKALKTGKSVKELILEEGVLNEEELKLILNPYEMTEPGIAGKELLEGH